VSPRNLKADPDTQLTHKGVDGMISRSVGHLTILAVLLTSAAHAQEGKPVTVRVLVDGQHCIVYSEKMRCDAVGTYLRDGRHVALSQPLDVIVDGNGDDSRAKGLKIRNYLTKVGYSKIAVVGVISEPGSTVNVIP